MLPRLLRAPLLVILLAGLLPLGCDSGSGSDPVQKPVDPPPDSVGGLIDSMVMPYSVEGRDLRLQRPMTVYRFCRTDDARPTVDTSEAGVERKVWSIVGDTLRLDSAVGYVSSWSKDSGKYVTEGSYASWDAYVRLSGTQGLEGAWRYVGERNVLISGVLDDNHFAPDENDRKHLEGALVTTLTFSGGTAMRTIERKPALELLAKWGGKLNPKYPADSTWYAITWEAVDVRHARITGRKSGEVVEIRWSKLGAEFTSSDSTHASYFVEEQPTACPNKPNPPWWVEFLDGNRR